MLRYRKTATHLLEGVAAAALLTCASTVRAQTAPRLDLDIPAQDLGESLKALALQSGRTVLADSTLVAGLQSPALRGRYTLEQALHRLLQGSGLDFVAVDGGFVVRKLAGSDRDARADGDNQEIVVTGSRLRGAPIASPVIRIGQQDIRDSGHSDLGSVIRSIPQSFGGGQNPGIGINVPLESGADLGGGSSANLRGLGSDATLTLLNGHRLAYTAVLQSVDVSAIPVAAVDRIEIVPDGASAIYGSDAVAGVANVILRRDYNGLETSARMATTTDGGDFEQQYGALAGKSWSSGGLFAAYEYGSNTAIRADQRSYAASRSPGLDLYPALRHHSAVASGHQDLGGGLSLAIDGLYNIRWSALTFPTVPGGNLDEGRATFLSVDRSFALAPSLTLDLGHDWQIALVGTYGKERVDFHQPECSYSDCTDASPGFYRNTAKSLEIDATGKLVELPGGPAKLAIGAGYRQVGFERFAGTGSVVNTTASREDEFAYGEVSLPLIGLGQGVTFANRVDASAAVRYERYPGMGDVATPKFGLTWAISPEVSIKGSWGKSFRTPTLYQQYQPRFVYLFPPASLGMSGYPPSAIGMLVLGGNPDLKPERATTWSTTLALDPRFLPGASLEVSYFSVHYRDRVVTPITYLSQALSNPIYAQHVVLDPSASQQAAVIAGAGSVLNATGQAYDPSQVIAIIDDSSVNAGRRTAHGIDLLASYKADLAHDQQLHLSLDVAYLDSNQQLSPAEPTIALAGTLFNPPHWRGQGAVSWTGGGLTLAANANYIGGVSDVRSAPAIRVGGMTTFDLTARYRLAAKSPLGGLDLSLSVANLFNAKPSPITTSLPYDTPYDSTNYSPVGRMIAVGISRKW